MKITPAKRGILVDAAEIAGGIIFGGIAIALADAGFHFGSFVVGFLAVGCGLLVFAHLIEKLGVKYVKVGLAASLISMGILFAFLAFHKPTTEAKSSPHFTFSISTPDSEKVALTNDFLIIKKANEFHPVVGFLYIPIDEAQSNLTLKINAQNDSASVAEDVEIGIFVPSDWQCVPDNGWMHVEQVDPSFSLMQYASGFVETNSLQVWAIRSPIPLLGGDGIVAPSIHLQRIHTFLPMSGVMNITAKAKDSHFNAVNFRLCILPRSFLKQHGSNKLFVSTAPIFTPLEKPKTLKK